jgi:serine/threonine protein kinase
VEKLMGNVPEDRFRNEVANHMAIQHENIVRLIGYCYEHTNKVVQDNGRYVIMENSESLLCYEYLPKGSLHNYIYGM